ncbi:MAG: hypothetical protein KAJ16_01820 [Calditrichia bacterium]|nr:hypothetical protein [Calditrichia bacterium]
MTIVCPSCNNQKSFRTPLWIKCTFRVEDDGMIKMLHLNQLESLEEKIADSRIMCKNCGAQAKVIFDEYQSTQAEKQQRKALEDI